MAYLNVAARTSRGFGAVNGRKVIPVPRVYFKTRGFGAPPPSHPLCPYPGGAFGSSPCANCCPIGNMIQDCSSPSAGVMECTTPRPTTQADCIAAGNHGPPCDPACIYCIADPVCTPGDAAHSDISCQDASGNVSGPHPPGPWNPNTSYQIGDIVWDTCGKLWEYGGGGFWTDLHDVMIGAGHVGTTGCVGPMGTTNMDPNWLTNALNNQPGGPPPFMTPAGIAQLAAAGNTATTGAAATGGNPPAPPASVANAAAAAGTGLPGVLTQNVQIGGTAIPAWLLAAAAALGIWAMA